MVTPSNRATSPAQTWIAVLLAFGFFITQLLHLPSLIVSDADEGTYVYAGRLMAEGLTPYNDFMIAHPPLVPALVAVVWKFDPSLMMVRIVFLLVVSVLGLTTFALVRRITSSAEAGLVAMALQTLGMLFVANMGRTVRLEPLMVGLIMAGTWALLRDRSRWCLVLSGGLYALALLVKFTAVAVEGPLLLAYLWCDVRGIGPRARIVGWTAAGAAIVLVPVMTWLFSTPHFVQWAIVEQSMRGRLPLDWRFEELLRSLIRFPFLLLALVAAVSLLVRNDRRPGVRPLAAGGIAGTTLLLLAFKSYYGFYIVAVLPLLTSCLAIELDRLARRQSVRSALWAPPMISAVALVACLAFVEFYDRFATYHVSSPAKIEALMEHVPGPIYTMVPDFVLWNGQRLPNWYYSADSFLPRSVGVLRDKDFALMLGGVNAAVLTSGEFDPYPEATATLERDFRRAYVDKYWTFWIRKNYVN
jgi:hypothetical protein